MDGIELLAPAGSFETALSAFKAGADAVYLGLDAFSARAQAVNFSERDLRDILAYARAEKRSVYVTFNTLLTDDELPDAVRKLALLEELAPDALIVQDLGVARIVKRCFPGLQLHASTQLAAHNLEGVLALKELGFTRVVLARELPIADIRSIARRCGCEIEVFVHGALCYSVSGLCLFSAMEKRRSGNRGRCAYCCRIPYTDAAGKRSLPFSMMDLRLDDRLGELRDAGVVSLKIEGRMKSALYVSSVVKRYREILDGVEPTVTRADLESVFSRRTTHLYADGWKQVNSSVVDSVNLGHQGTFAGEAKRLTKDRDGRTWLRFHTVRALEKHDGLQFVQGDAAERPLGTGIGEMRLAISRKPVFEAPSGSDVEVELTDPGLVAAVEDALSSKSPRKPLAVFCSMSNSVKRRFPVPSFRPADYPGTGALSVTVRILQDRIEAQAADVFVSLPLTDAQKAKNPDLTGEAVRKAFSKLGDTGWFLAELAVEDPHSLYAPASILNSLRRELTARLADGVARRRERKTADALAMLGETRVSPAAEPIGVVKIRLGQDIPDGNWDETVVAIGHTGEVPEYGCDVRLALPVFTKEDACNRLRGRVKTLLRRGFTRWEAADLAGLRMLKALGADDITADWSLYAFNSQAAAQLAELGVKRVVASPERDVSAGENVFPVHTEYLSSQSTPLFISVTKPLTDTPHSLADQSGGEFVSYELEGLWITVRSRPRTFPVPAGASSRLDLSWDAPCNTCTQ